MACNINTGLTAVSCEQKEQAIGGFKPRLWIGNTDDIDSTAGIKGFTYDVNGNIDAITFKATKGLFVFNANKDSVGATASRTRTEAGIPLYPQGITFKAFDITAVQRAVLDDLAKADSLFAILETSAGQFEVFGKDLGLVLGDANEKNYGALRTDDTSSNIALSSIGELSSPVPFFDVDYATTLSLIESYEV